MIFTSFNLRRLGRVFLSLLVLSPLFAAEAQTLSAPPPQFKEFPATGSTFEKAPLRLSEEDMLFRTRYRRLYSSEPNFAGHYAITFVGCGGGCVFPLQLDLQTGTSARLEFSSGEEVTDCSDEYLDAQGNVVEKAWYFRADSRLLVVGGSMPGLECGARFYEERNGTMIHIRDISLQRTP